VRITIISLLLAASATLTGYCVLMFSLFEPTRDTVPLLACTGVLWAVFAAAVFLLRRVRGRAVVVLVLAGSLGIGVAAMVGPPNTSTDSARYAWDGIVQNAGISPYAYVPADDRLDPLRPEWLFPATVRSGTVPETCQGQRIVVTHKTASDAVLCTALNRPTVPTIYPPAAELYFAGIRFLVPATATYWPLQLGGLLLSLGTTVMLLVGMHRRGITVRFAAYWAWCPLVASEAITNSHVDLLGVTFTLAAAFCLTRARYWLGGIALGVAIAVKLVPVIAAPAMLRRQGWKVGLAAAVTFLALYVPYELMTGIGVLGYLPGYLSEEGYSSGNRFALISLIAPGGAAVFVAGGLLVLIAALVLWKTDPDRPWLGQLVMIGSTLLILSPRYPWYALLLLPFVALSGRWEWLAIPLALMLRQILPSLELTWAISAALGIVVGGSVVRLDPAARARMLGVPLHAVRRLRSPR
jgi:hypothetical protein